MSWDPLTPAAPQQQRCCGLVIILQLAASITPRFLSQVFFPSHCNGNNIREQTDHCCCSVPSVIIAVFKGGGASPQHFICVVFTVSLSLVDHISWTSVLLPLHRGVSHSAWLLHPQSRKRRRADRQTTTKKHHIAGKEAGRRMIIPTRGESSRPFSPKRPVIAPVHHRSSDTHTSRLKRPSETSRSNGAAKMMCRPAPKLILPNKYLKPSCQAH